MTSQLSGLFSNTNEQVREREPWLVWQPQCQTLSRASIARCVCLCVCVICILKHLYVCQYLLSPFFPLLPFFSFSLSSSILSRSLSSKNSDPCIRSVWQMTAGADNPLSACAATVNNTVPCHRTTLAKAHISYPSKKLLLNSPSPLLPILLSASPNSPYSPLLKPHPDTFFGSPNDQNILWGKVNAAAYFKVKSSTQRNVGPNGMCVSLRPWILSKWRVTDLAVSL